ncbi:20125_t:CDS:2, partial [Rhizophagus irregularis]
NSSNLNIQKHAFMDVNGNLSHIDSSTILDVLRGEDSMDDINMKIQARHLYSNLFGMSYELYDTDESIDESDSRKILNPYMVKSKGRPRNKRFKSSVETCKNSSKGTGSNAFIQDNNGHEGGSLQ